jgi:hypothetical protein
LGIWIRTAHTAYLPAIMATSIEQELKRQTSAGGNQDLRYREYTVTTSLKNLELSCLDPCPRSGDVICLRVQGEEDQWLSVRELGEHFSCVVAQDGMLHPLWDMTDYSARCSWSVKSKKYITHGGWKTHSSDPPPEDVFYHPDGDVGVLEEEWNRIVKRGAFTRPARIEFLKPSTIKILISRVSEWTGHGKCR